MKRKGYGRDRGLTIRMIITSALLGLLYVAFAVVLFSVLNVGLVPMLVIVIGLAFFQYYTSDKLALRAAGAKVVERDQAPQLYDTVERLAAMAELPMPRVAIVDTEVPNAFATGRDPKHAVVAVTTGLMRRLEPQEIESVLAHELTHVKNRDVRTMTLASFFAMLAAFISRYREYAADRGSAIITGAPEYLMSALQKISSQMALIPQRDLREVQGMNAFFIIPASVKQATSELFMDHPPLEKRLAALSQIAREMGRPV